MVSTEARDLDGNPLSYAGSDAIFTFTTATPSPAIVLTSPVDGAVNVPVNVLSSSGITVTFSKPMDQSLVKQSKLTLKDLTDDDTLTLDLTNTTKPRQNEMLPRIGLGSESSFE